MAGDFQGRVAIITGGASGIGRALSEELAKRGAEVVVTDRQGAVAAKVADSIVKTGGAATAAELDVRDASAIERLAQSTLDRAGRIDLLFNNAGIAVGGEMADYQLADWDDVLDVNLRGVVYGIQAVYPKMVAQGAGHIVNTASMAGLVAFASEGSYAASKHAVVGLSKSLRLEAKAHGVKVSVLCPGAIRTPILTGGKYGRISLLGVSHAKIMEIWEQTRPMDVGAFAEEALDAVARNQAIIVLPRWWKAFWYLDRISPTLAEWVSRRMYARIADELEGARGESAG